MPAATTLTVLGLGLAAASTAYQVKSSNDARDDAEAAADKQAKQEQAAADELKLKEKAEQERNAQVQLRSQTTGTPRSDSINASPLANIGGTGGKQLLGL
jgi:hypothetical protein